MAYQTSLQFSRFNPDFCTMMRMLHEYATDVMPNCQTRFPVIKYRRRVTPYVNRQDDLHNEVLPHNREWDYYDFPIYIESQQESAELKREGIDGRRDLTAWFALPVLEEQGLIIQQNALEFNPATGEFDTEISPATKDHGPLLPLADLGDWFYWQGAWYEIKDFTPDQFWANTEIPCWYIAPCTRERPDTTADATLDDQGDDWRDDPLNNDYDEY